MNLKKIFLVLALTIPFSFSLLFSESVDVDHFIIAPSMNGCGGYIKNQSSHVIGGGTYSLGLHKFMLKFNYGFMDFLEAGAFVDFGAAIDSSSDVAPVFQVLTTTSFNVKARFLDEDIYFVSMAAGIERFPVMVFDNEQHPDFRIYAAASKKIGDMEVSIGVKKQLDAGSFDFSNWGFAANVSKVMADTVLVMLEYDERTFNAGVKVSFNPNLSVDFFILGLEKIGRAEEIGTFLREYFVFGITYLQ